MQIGQVIVHFVSPMQKQIQCFARRQCRHRRRRRHRGRVVVKQYLLFLFLFQLERGSVMGRWAAVHRRCFNVDLGQQCPSGRHDTIHGTSIGGDFTPTAEMVPKRRQMPHGYSGNRMKTEREQKKERKKKGNQCPLS